MDTPPEDTNGDKVKKVIKKRKYSRGGCNECKRRKIKCDETKPHCHNCSRLEKSCLYSIPSKFRFEVPNKSLTKNKNVNKPRVIHENQDAYMPVLNEEQQQQSLPSNSKSIKISDILSPETDFLNDYNWGSIAPTDVRNLFDDASLLVHDSLSLFNYDYNNLEISPPMLPNNDITFMNDFPIEDIKGKIYVRGNPVSTETAIFQMSNSDLVDLALEKLDLLKGPHKNYLYTLSMTNLNFHIFPFAENFESNQVLKILLKYSQNCSYLLTSLLAISATFQYNQTGEKVHEQNRSKYVSVCLKSLSEAFPQQSGKESFASMANDIERLLLTILILTSNFTATAYEQKEMSTVTRTKSNWKTHLRGVKELLLKYMKLANCCKKNINNRISDGLALAKTWFFALESLAELNDPLGGTLKYQKKNISEETDIIKTDDELDCSDQSHLWLETGYFDRTRNKEYHDTLIKIGLLTSPTLQNPVQFNLFNGYSMEVVRLIDELSKSLDLLRDHNNAQLSGSRITKIMSFIELARKNEFVPKVSKHSFKVPIESQGHPTYMGIDKILLPKSCFATEQHENGEDVYYSWFDLSEQMHVDSMYLKVLTTVGLLKLPKSHPLIKEVRQKILSSLFFIKEKTGEVPSDDIFLESEHFYLKKGLFDARAIMIQSVCIQCYKIVDTLIGYEKLELFFNGLIKLGNGSSVLTLEFIRKSKENFINGVEDDEESLQIQNNIPFS